MIILVSVWVTRLVFEKHCKLHLYLWKSLIQPFKNESLMVYAAESYIAR